jgi:hypothetical protein
LFAKTPVWNQAGVFGVSALPLKGTSSFSRGKDSEGGILPLPERTFSAETGEKRSRPADRTALESLIGEDA